MPHGRYVLYDKCIIDFEHSKIYLAGQEEIGIHLRPQLSALLHRLILEKEQNRSLLHEELWELMKWSSGDSNVGEKEHRVISDLRRKLRPFNIQVPNEGEGYHLIYAPVNCATAESLPVVPETPKHDFYEVTKSDDYRAFTLRIFRKYYGESFLTDMNGHTFMVYTIPGNEYSVSQNIAELDERLCPKKHLVPNLCEDSTFDTRDHQGYTNCPYFREYYDAVGTNIHFPDRPGYMLDSIELDQEGKVDYITAHVGTYAENVYSSHAIEYELYLAYLKYRDADINDEQVWAELYNGLTMRNHIHGEVGHPGEVGFLEKMKRSLLHGQNRHALIGLEMLVLVRNPITHKYRVLLGERSNKVAMVQNVYEFPPAGGFEVLCDSDDGIYTEDEIVSDYSPGGAIFREYLEELFSLPEFDGTGTGSILDRILPNPHIREIQNLFQLDKARFQFLGISVDLLLMRQNLDFVLVIDDEEYPEGGFQVNDEYKKGRLLADVTLENIDNMANMWKRHHGPSAGVWYLFKQTELYKQLASESDITD